MGSTSPSEFVWIRLQDWDPAAAPQGVDKIIGGYECSPHSQPWQVSLNTGYHFCGGSLIADQWVLSAAHCWYYPDSMQVILGDHNIQVFEHTEHLMRIETIVLHPSYDEQTLDHDIMLIKLAHRIQPDAYVQPVPLPTACPEVGSLCMVSGWGNILSDGLLSAKNLQCVEVPIVSDQVCERSYPGMITSTMMCAGYLEGGKDACQGDAGGPLVCNGELQGIMSWGFGWAQKDHPSIYTKICSLLSWIKSTMAAN
ncbi:trypsin-2-like [Trachemys scripta elegans]|uniref:trypsin-2-like n=1 Tax=Trachemys scripta elegans TaxID=31138 RepID=UPI0015574EC4|nr:trypsin-2-like [Trachemys scripta elegans]